MNWWDAIKGQDRQEDCAKRIMPIAASAYRAHFSYEEEITDELLSKAWDAAYAESIKEGASDEEATVVANAIAERHRRNSLNSARPRRERRWPYY